MQASSALPNATIKRTAEHYRQGDQSDAVYGILMFVRMRVQSEA